MNSPTPPLPEDSTLMLGILRVGEDIAIDVGELAVHRALTHEPVRYLDNLRKELAEIASGDTRIELPPKQLFADDGGGDFRVMPCVTRGKHRTTKTVKVIGTNLVQQLLPDQITVGKALALHPVENHVTHVFDACLLSSARTGACAALAIDLLADARKTVAVVGAGRVGYYSALYALALGGIERISIADAFPGRAAKLSSLLAQSYPHCRFEPVEPDMAAADVVILATTSREPVCHPPAGGARLIVSLGADTDFQRELSAAWIDHADIFVDTADSAHFGDLRRWIDEGLMDKDCLRDLFDVMRNGVTGTRPRVFVSTGSALFDNLTIAYLLEREAAGFSW